MNFNIIEGLNEEDLNGIYEDIVSNEENYIAVCVCGNCSAKSKTNSYYCVPIPWIHDYSYCNSVCTGKQCTYYMYNAGCTGTPYSSNWCDNAVSYWSECR
ncbi:hypothetical protein IJ843_04520 [bacterium]|nr:hypothetical protein [bacterium]